MVGNNNTHPVTMIVWIVFALPLHTINHRWDEGIVELGDDRRGESNNKQQQTQNIFS